MPHSAGGGSHGGGFRSTGFIGSAITGRRLNGTERPKSQWFAGSRLYLKHNSDGSDEYVYANSMPVKARLAPIIVMTIIYSLLFPLMGRSVYELAPHKINAVYSDAPSVYDEINAIKNKEELTDAITEYQKATGICPVIYTVYKDDYTRTMKEVAYDKYVGTFADEQHFLILYAVSKDDQTLLNEGKISVPNYTWEAVQGNETDLLMSQKVFREFAGIVQSDLESGKDPGTAFSEAFRFAQKQTSSAMISNAIMVYAPILVAAAFFIGLLAFFVRKFWKEKDAVYEQIHMGSDPNEFSGGYSGNITGKPRTTAVSEIRISKTRGIGSVIGSIISAVLTVAGIVMLALGIAFVVHPATDTGFGIFFVVLGVFWIVMGILGLTAFISTLSNIRKFKKNMKASAPESKDVKKDNEPKTAAEDEDYERMKRHGFE